MGMGDTSGPNLFWRSLGAWRMGPWELIMEWPWVRRRVSLPIYVDGLGRMAEEDLGD